MRPYRDCRQDHRAVSASHGTACYPQGRRKSIIPVRVSRYIGACIAYMLLACVICVWNPSNARMHYGPPGVALDVT